MISIVLFTIMFAVELFYLTQNCSFLGCFFEYLTLFIPFRFAVYPWKGLRSSVHLGHVPLFIRR